MTQTINIRPATIGDLDAVAAVERRCFPEDEAFSRRQLRYLLEQAEGASYVACRGQEVVGYITLLTRRTARNLRIYSVAVDPGGPRMRSRTSAGGCGDCIGPTARTG